MIETTYSKLFKPVTLPNGIVLPNRFCMCPVTTNSSTREGFVTQEDIDYARRRSHSAPLQVTSAAYIEPYGQLFEYSFSIDDDRSIPGLTKLAEAMQQDGAHGIIQLAHAGRFSTQAIKDYGVSYGPSAMELKTPIPHQVLAMSERKIRHVIQAYGDATRRAIKAGFSGVEISMAQRLLPQTFFSTFSNKRDDQYGADTLENRARLTLEIFKEVQRVIDEEAPDNFILGFRGTPEETRGDEVGYSIQEYLTLLDWVLEIANVQYFAVASWGKNIYLNKVRSQGNYHGQYINEVVQRHLSGRTVTMATGGINSPDKSLEALEHGDMVGLSSVFVTEPDFVTKIEDGRAEDIDLGIDLDNIDELAIPQAAFKDLIKLMDLGQSLSKDTTSTLKELEKNYTQ